MPIMLLHNARHSGNAHKTCISNVPRFVPKWLEFLLIAFPKMHNLRGLVFVAVAAFAAAVPAPVSRHEIHEKRTISPDWVKRDRVHQDVKLPMRIGLTQSNLDRGYDYLMDV
jgi:hypothetical protein